MTTDFQTFGREALPRVTVLPVLQPLLLAFAAVFSKPQQRHFDQSIPGLIVQDPRRTLTGMRRHGVDAPDPSSWDRFVTTAPGSFPSSRTTGVPSCAGNCGN